MEVLEINHLFHLARVLPSTDEFKELIYKWSSPLVPQVEKL